MSKRRIKSKSHWFNGVIAALAAAELSIGVLQAVLPVNVFAILTFVLVIGNAVLREMTSTGIGKSHDDAGPV